MMMDGNVLMAPPTPQHLRPPLSSASSVGSQKSSSSVKSNLSALGRKLVTGVSPSSPETAYTRWNSPPSPDGSPRISSSHRSRSPSPCPLPPPQSPHGAAKVKSVTASVFAAAKAGRAQARSPPMNAVGSRSPNYNPYVPGSPPRQHAPTPKRRTRAKSGSALVHVPVPDDGRKPFGVILWNTQESTASKLNAEAAVGKNNVEAVTSKTNTNSTPNSLPQPFNGNVPRNIRKACSRDGLGSPIKTPKEANLPVKPSPTPSSTFGAQSIATLSNEYADDTRSQGTVATEEGTHDRVLFRGIPTSFSQPIAPDEVPPLRPMASKEWTPETKVINVTTLAASITPTASSPQKKRTPSKIVAPLSISKSVDQFISVAYEQTSMQQAPSTSKVGPTAAKLSVPSGLHSDNDASTPRSSMSYSIAEAENAEVVVARKEILPWAESPSMSNGQEIKKSIFPISQYKPRPRESSESNLFVTSRRLTADSSAPTPSVVPSNLPLPTSGRSNPLPQSMTSPTKPLFSNTKPRPEKRIEERETKPVQSPKASTRIAPPTFQKPRPRSRAQSFISTVTGRSTPNHNDSVRVDTDKLRQQYLAGAAGPETEKQRVEREFEALMETLQVPESVKAKMATLDHPVKSAMLKSSGSASLGSQSMVAAALQIGEATTKPPVAGQRKTRPRRSRSNSDIKGLNLLGLNFGQHKRTTEQSEQAHARKTQTNAPRGYPKAHAKSQSTMIPVGQLPWPSQPMTGATTLTNEIIMSSSAPVKSAFDMRTTTNNSHNASNKVTLATTSSSCGGGKEEKEGSAWWAVRIKTRNYRELTSSELKRFRVALRTQPPQWVTQFVSYGGYESMLRRLKELLEVEWREEQHDDQILYEMLRAFKALLLTEPGREALKSRGLSPFIQFVELLYSEKKPGDLASRQHLAELIQGLFDLYPPTQTSSQVSLVARKEDWGQGIQLTTSPATLQQHSALPVLNDSTSNVGQQQGHDIVKALLMGQPDPKFENMTEIVAVAQRPRRYKRLVAELSGVLMDYFWIFCHSDNKFWDVKRLDEKEIEAPKVPSGMTGGVEYESMLYCTALLRLINDLVKTAPSHSEGRLIHNDLFASGIERCLLTLRKCSTAYYPHVHLELARYIASAKSCGADITPNILKHVAGLATGSEHLSLGSIGGTSPVVKSAIEKFERLKE